MPMFASPSLRIPAVLRQLLLAATALFLASCGGGGSSNDNDPTVEPSSSYVGNWYNAAADYYLVISADNTLSYRVCSSTGYRELTEAKGATLNGNAVMVGSETVGHLQRTGNSLTYVEIPAFLFVLHSTIPATCRGNFLEIVSVTPLAATAQTPTQFTVNFAYQLSTRDTASVKLGFNTSGPASHVFEPSMGSMTIHRGPGAGSLTATVTPVRYDSPNYFSALVLMAEDPSLTAPSLASAQQPIHVAPAAAGLALKPQPHDPGATSVLSVASTLCALRGLRTPCSAASR